MIIIATTANLNSYSELLLYILSVSKDISRIATVDNSAYIILQKYFLKSKPKIVLSKQILKQKPIIVFI